MSTQPELLFSVADELRSFKDKVEIVEDLMNAVSGSLRDRLLPLKGKTLEEIQTLLTADLLEELKAELPERLQFVLTPVGEIDDHLINLGDWSKEDKMSLAPVTVRAAASGSVELDGVLDKDLSQVLQGPIPEGSALFTVSLQGQIGIDAKGAGGTPIVSLSVSAFASRTQELVVGFMRSARAPVLLELLRIRDYFVNPGDLSAVMRLFADKSARLIQHHYVGKHSIGLKIALEDSLTRALSNLAPDTPISAAAKAEMSFSVSLKNEDDFKVTVERDSASSAFVHLERKRTVERSRVFKIGFSIEIKGLKQQIAQKIGELLPDRAEVAHALQRLDDLVERVQGTDLSELVERELGARFEQHAELFEKLLGTAPANAPRSRIIDEIRDALVDRISGRVNLLSDAADAAAARISNEIAIALGIGEPEFRDFLSGSAESAIEQLQEKLKNEIAALKAPEVRQILEPLSGVNKTVDRAFDAIKKDSANSAQRARAALEEIYSKYTGFRQKLIDLIDERVTEQAAFAFIRENIETDEATTLLSFRILEANDETADLYAAVWSRRLDDVAELIERAKDAITDVDGIYTIAFTKQKRSAFSLNLFGLVKKGTEVLFSDEVAVSVDHTGTLVVAESRDKLRIARHNRSESQTLTVEWSFDATKNDLMLLPPVKVAVEINDKSFDRGDLRAFFENLNKLQCVKPDAFDAVAAELLGGTDSQAVLEGISLGLVVALTWNELLPILGADRDGTPRSDKWDGLEVGEKLFRIVRRGHTSESHFDDLERLAALDNVDPFALLLKVGELGSPFAKHPKLRKYHAIGRAIQLFEDHLAKLQAKWLAFMVALRTERDPEKIREMLSGVDGELRSVFVELFFSRTFPAFPDMSDVWQASCGARLLLDHAKRAHLLLTMEGPQIARRIVD